MAEAEPLSGFLLQYVLNITARQAPFIGHAGISAAQLSPLVEPLTRVPLRPMCGPARPISYHVGPGLVVMVCEVGDAAAVWVGSRWRSALMPLRASGVEWEWLDA